MEVFEGGELGHAGARVLLADLSTSAPSIHTQALPPSHTTPPVAHTHLAGNRYVASAQNSVHLKESVGSCCRAKYCIEVETGERALNEASELRNKYSAVKEY